MKKILFFVFLSINYIFGQNLQSFLSTATFYTDEGPFLETYISFNANSLFLVEKDGKYCGKIDVRIIINQDDSIVFKDHYILNSPLFDQLSNNLIFFIDQQRIPLKNGVYELKILVSDLYSNAKDTLKENIMIDYDSVSVSDIQLIDNYVLSNDNNKLTKSGYQLSPFVSNFYPKEIKKLIYYVEIYNTDLLSKPKYLLHTYIESFGTKVPLFDYNQVYRKVSSNIQSKIFAFDISNLPTGNYNIVCEIRSSTNKLLTIKKKFFQRSNKSSEVVNYNDLNTIDLRGKFIDNIKNKDSLRNFIDYLYPISSPQENTFAQNQLNYNDIELMKKFFFNFWISRDVNNPELAWINYLQKVKSVNNTFRYFQIEGYLTDRGRVYLQYGPPNSRHLEVDSKDSRPYEIWHYYNLGKYTDKKFVFIDNNRTGEYKLEFSNVDGEESNLEWIQDVEYNRQNNSDFRDNYINPR